MRRGSRKQSFTSAVAALLVLVAWASGAGCQPLPDDCPDRLRCPADPQGDAGSAGGLEPEDPACVPGVDQGVPATCGVFLRKSGDDANTGAPDAPVATFARALALAGATRRVYACAEDLSEAVVVTSTVTVYGGLDCDHGWIQGSARTRLTAPPGAIPLIVKKAAAGVRLKELAITSADAASGASSIAAVIEGAVAQLVHCDLVAGRGGDGLFGASAPTAPADPGAPGKTGGAECSADKVIGGAGGVTTCGGVMLQGGTGGPGGPTTGGPGTAGMMTPGGSGGPGGQGDTGEVGWTCAGNLGLEGVGVEGADGDEGDPGRGGTGLGAISLAGFKGDSGGEGAPGKPGTPGGGGGGRAALSSCVDPSAGGASGGGGGAGGCGGLGGSGGKAGGSSIALVSLGASLELVNVTLTAHDGGRGGDGGDSQPGGVGGPPGLGGLSSSRDGCSGGQGGSGGPGGPGGGGSGGHSVGIAYVGPEPSLGSTQIVLGAAGPGGSGGRLNAKLNGGANGHAVQTLSFN